MAWWKNSFFFLCSQADFMFCFFFSRSFSGAGASFTSYARVCFHVVSPFLCCVNLWMLPVHFYFTPCVFLEEKMPLHYLYDCQTVQKGDTDWRPGRHPWRCFLSSFEGCQAPRVCGGSCLTHSILCSNLKCFYARVRLSYSWCFERGKLVPDASQERERNRGGLK